MPNKRVFYASHAVALGGVTVQGAQSVSIDTNFNLEDIFQLGRLAAYDSVPQDPTVEINITKAMDGHPLMWNLMAGAATADLLDATAGQQSVALTVGNDTDTFLAENALPANPTILMDSGNITSFNYTISVDGNFTEEVTISATTKQIIPGGIAAPVPDPIGGVVLARQNYKKTSIVPALVANQRLSQITISADTGSESLYELGSFYPFYKAPNLPVEITVAFDVIAQTHDMFEVETQTVAQCGSPAELVNKESIVIYLCDGEGNTTYTFDMTDNESPAAKLNSVSYSGGDTSGGNVTITYTYLVSNMLKITSANF